MENSNNVIADKNPRKRTTQNNLFSLGYFTKKPKISESSDKNASESTENRENTEETLKTSDNFKVSTEICTSATPSTSTCNLNEKYDIANFVMNNCLDADAISVALKNLWRPDPGKFKFPFTLFGTKNRRLRYEWLIQHAWLTYSAKTDGAYCRYCVFFAQKFVGKSSSQVVGQLVNESLRNWRKALEKFSEHQATEYHSFSVLKADNLNMINEKRQLPISRALDDASEKKAIENRKKIEPIVKTVLLCGRNGWPLRGHRDSGKLDIMEQGSSQEGTFRQLLRFRIDAGDDTLKSHLESCGSNSTYISWNIQNQIIDACNKIILDKIVAMVNAAKYFSVLADETADIANKEQMTLCVRFVNSDNIICERFLQFVEVTSTTGETLAASIIKTLDSVGLDLKNLRGQGYDGAAAMSGQYKGR